MKKLIFNAYCTRDKDTQVCPLHEAYDEGLSYYAALMACLHCKYSMQI